MEQSISQISLSSRLPFLRHGSKQPASTNHDSHLTSTDSSTSTPTPNFDHPRPSPKVLQLQSQIRHIEKSRAELQLKFEKIIENLLQEIYRKEESNTKLEAQINELSHELTDSKCDLGIIVQVIRKKHQRSAENFKRAPLINTNKITPKLDKSISGSKQTVNLSTGTFKVDRKNRSPRLLQQKSFKE